MSDFQERIGEGLVRIGSLTPSQCEDVIQRQNAGDKRLFGEIAVAMGYVDFDSLISFLKDRGEAKV